MIQKLLLFLINIIIFFSFAAEAFCLSPYENEILKEINIARTNPEKYAEYIGQMKKNFSGKYFKVAGKLPLKTKEGIKAVEQAIHFLEKVQPMQPLVPSKGLSKGAEILVEKEGKSGRTGHMRFKGYPPWKRAGFFGTWKGSVAENISYGKEVPREVIACLIIDDGVRSRGHRKNIFNERFKKAGVSSGYHSGYGSMCVILFAEDYIEKG